MLPGFCSTIRLEYAHSLDSSTCRRIIFDSHNKLQYLKTRAFVHPNPSTRDSVISKLSALISGTSCFRSQATEGVTLPSGVVAVISGVEALRWPGDIMLGLATPRHRIR
ncbi:hypothetical protein EYF80_035058 [Liparis tanakae]|uniref:Uncharacterized protein n=1 Tax=Liparis tanakae TaxID=230148 RepID=A0A4Z2GNJ2_9TELE|nr:hypothetical protein EYF80_035058 [Liparis tanakae]